MKTLPRILKATTLLAGVLWLNTSQAALVAHFKLDEGSLDPYTNMAYSSVGNWSATFGGSIPPAWITELPPVPSSEGGTTAALQFTAAGQGQALTTFQGVTGTNARTITAWIKPAPTQPNNATFVSYGSNGTAARLSFRIESTTGADFGKPRCEIQGNARIGSTVLTDGKWHHVAFVMTNGARLGDTLIYVDGNLETMKLANTTPSANYVINTGTNNFVCIGNSTHGAGYWFNGGVDDVRIYDEALSGTRILEMVYGAGNPPAISVQPKNQGAVLGDVTTPVTFSVGYSGSPTLYFQWKHSGTNLPGQTQDTLVIGPPVADTHMGAYTVTVSNLYGVANSSPAILSWTTAPIEPPRQVSIVGQKASFFVSMPAGNSYTYQWQRAGQDIPGATGSSYVRSGLVPADSTTYTVRATLNGISATSAPASLLVLPVPASAYAALVLEDGPAGFWRLGEAFGATVATDQTTFHPGTFVNFSGFELGQPGAPLNEADTAASFSSMGNYVEVPFSADLNNARGFSLEVWAMPTGTSGRQSMIASRTRTLSSGYELLASGATWQFRTGASVDTSVEYWNDLNGGTVTPNVWSHVVATYDGSVKRLYVNGAQVASTTVNVFPSPGTPMRIGADETYQATAGSFFNGSLDEVAVYRKALTADQIRDHYNLGKIGLGVPPAFVLPPRSQQALLGDTNATINFRGDVTGSPRLRYTWKKNGTTIENQDTSTLVLSPVTATDLAVYALAVTNASGGILSTNVVLSYGTGPVTPAAQTVLQNARATFSLTGMPAYQTYGYQWKRDGQTLPGATGATLTIPAANSSDAGTYTVLVSLGSDTVESAPVTLAVVPAPTATYTNIIMSGGTAPIGYWRLGEANAYDQVMDMVGGRHGLYQAAAQPGAEGVVLGDPDTALECNGGPGSFAEVYYDPAINPNTFTIECWALVRGGENTYRAPLTCREWTAGNYSGCNFFAASNNRWEFWLGQGATALTLTGPPVEEHSWVHLAATYDGANAAFYVNGTLATNSPAVYVPNPFNPLRIGAGGASLADHYFRGLVDEVVLYGSALPASTIAAHYAGVFQPGSPARFTQQPRSRHVLAGETYTTTVGVHTVQPAGLVWQRNGAPIPGANGTALTIPNLAASGNYAAVVTNTSGSRTSQVAAVSMVAGQATSVSFRGTGTRTIAANGNSAGFVLADNWNEIGAGQASGTATGLVDATGVNQGITVNWTSAGAGTTGVGFTDPRGDYAMMDGWIQGNSTAAIGITFNGIPQSYQTGGYTAYVYLGTEGVTDTTLFGFVSVGNVTNYYHGTNLSRWNGDYILATSTDELNMPPANYAVFPNLTAPTLTITAGKPANASGPARVGGVQLVANASLPPVLEIGTVDGAPELRWSGNWTLQRKTLLDNNPGSWTDVTTESPYRVPTPLGVQQFYRLRSH